MFDPARLIRPHIQNMPAYEPILPFEVLSQQLNRPADQIIKLDANENPYGAAAGGLASPGCHALRPHLSRSGKPGSTLRHLCHITAFPVDNILAGAGADELIDLILRLVIEPGDKIINCPPTFGMYAFDADLNAARVIQVPRQA